MPGDECYIKVFNEGFLSVIQDRISRTAVGGKDELYVWYRGSEVNVGERHLYKSFPSVPKINFRLAFSDDFAPGEGIFAEPLGESFNLASYGLNQVSMFMFYASRDSVLPQCSHGARSPAARQVFAASASAASAAVGVGVAPSPASGGSAVQCSTMDVQVASSTP